MAKTTKKETNKEIDKKIKFTKSQILKAKRYTNIEKDILRTLLKDIHYSLTEVDKLLTDFKEKEVK